MTTRRVFWLFLLLTLALAIHYRQVGWDVANLGYRFGQLYLNKEFVAKLDVHGTYVFVYAEQIRGKHLKILDIENLQPIIKKAFNDHETFIAQKYPEILIANPEAAQGYPKNSKLSIIFVSRSTYQSLNKVVGKESSGYIGFLNTIYLDTYGNNYSIKGMKTTIRHEIFHYLNNYYELAAEFEETAAKRFGAF